MAVGASTPLIEVSVSVLVGAGRCHLAGSEVTVHPGFTRGGVGDVYNGGWAVGTEHAARRVLCC